MAGDIEEPFRLSFQADSWQSGSISFSRLENEAICWERRSFFTHNRYLEEVEKYSKPDYEGDFEQVNEIGHSARFVENHDRAATLLSTHLSKNGKYQAENTGYDGDFKRVNEVGDSARFEESFDRSNNGDIEVTECGREGSSNRYIEATERGGKDSIIFHSGRQNEQ
ncbi:hypothetical protein CQW23_08992 [Capsicum baccatum]|uniref:Uncharacterized protein n=1 Tax=Capsicum baccatum TaxID=33114 RepID=A0A2G2XAM9_CAPBA|nr:hypothetical protein CQW23_08992 [Capsicum baccatum]